MLLNIDSFNHVRGQSLYVDDVVTHRGTLYAAVFGSPYAHAEIHKIKTKQAKGIEGVVKIVTAKDIPGENQIGSIIADEPLLATDEVHYQGQPIAIVLAKTEDAAREAVKLIEVKATQKWANTNPVVAHKNGDLLSPSRTFKLGSLKEGFLESDIVVEGEVEVGGQEHLYLETQGAYAYLEENGHIKVVSSTQGPTVVQKCISRVLGLPMSKIEVDVRRLGGGFGGKEDQASPWAAMAAVGAYLTKKPVKCILHRMDDMRMTGKRHPYTARYKMGLSKDGKIRAYKVTFFQNGGAAADLSPAVLERTLFHATNSYFIPNVKAIAHSCRTNLPPNTAFRGFGGPQGMFVVEAAISHAANVMNKEATEIQLTNLLNNGDEFPYGQIVEQAEAQNCWEYAHLYYNIEGKKEEINTFNNQNTYLKKGMAFMPICFGISFTNTPMNNARALVHIYSDGSISVSTGAVEMGQGVNTKMAQIAAATLGVKLTRVKIESTNTTRVANTSPSAASATADLNGKAVIDACQQIKKRLMVVVREMLGVNGNVKVKIKDGLVYKGKEKTTITWEQVIAQAIFQRINLSAKGHYATPVIHFDKKQEKGHPFAYHVYGFAALTCTVDCIRGTYSFDSVDIVHDFGKSMNSHIDLGQVEGGLVQGMGWMTMEDLAFSDEGRLLSNALSTYKIPDIHAVPKKVRVMFLRTSGHEMAVLKSKAVGEPPLMYGIGAYFAIKNAIKAFNPEWPEGKDISPMTPERVLMALYNTN